MADEVQVYEEPPNNEAATVTVDFYVCQRLVQLARREDALNTYGSAFSAALVAFVQLKIDEEFARREATKYPPAPSYHSVAGKTALEMHKAAMGRATPLKTIRNAGDTNVL